MVEFTDTDQGRTFKDKKEAGKFCYYAVCAVALFLMISVIASIIEKA